jgi:hypothetical protein
MEGLYWSRNQLMRRILLLRTTSPSKAVLLQFRFTIHYFSLYFLFPYIILLDPQT